MYEMNIVYAARTETRRDISQEDLANRIEEVFSHNEKERAKEIIVFNLSMPAPHSKPTGTQPEQQAAP
jgi:hypothetical protein